MDLLPQRSGQLRNCLLSFLLATDLLPTLDGNLTPEVLAIRIAVNLAPEFELAARCALFTLVGSRAFFE